MLAVVFADLQPSGAAKHGRRPELLHRPARGKLWGAADRGQQCCRRDSTHGRRVSSAAPEALAPSRQVGQGAPGGSGGGRSEAGSEAWGISLLRRWPARGAREPSTREVPFMVEGGGGRRERSETTMAGRASGHEWGKKMVRKGVRRLIPSITKNKTA